jgi:hypothetical protein
MTEENHLEHDEALIPFKTIPDGFKVVEVDSLADFNITTLKPDHPFKRYLVNSEDESDSAFVSKTLEVADKPKILSFPDGTPISVKEKLHVPDH